MSNPALLEKFELQEGVYFQSGLERNKAFEKKYLAIREKENRIYTDEQVRILPQISSIHPHHHEWRLRKDSMQRLIRYINQKEFKTILEIGCGNGWLSSHLAETKAEVFALDMNEVELIQGARVYKGIDNLKFLYADVLSNPFNKENVFDLIVLASSIQYFSNVGRLIQSLQPLLTKHGEIHIFDSPIYQNQKEASLAKKRSEEYFNNMEHSWMSQYYFQHTIEMFNAYDYKILYNPSSLYNKLKNVFFKTSPFPWILIGNFNA
jgi:2-polyprenyl-3-methyl-5-hydroxy-6-metoxy-1,4-benzoquinol methylase